MIGLNDDEEQRTVYNNCGRPDEPSQARERESGSESVQAAGEWK